MIHVRALGAAVCAGLLIAACAGSETTPTSPTTPPSNAVPPPTTPTTPVGAQQPTVPSTFGGRCVEVQGTVSVAASSVTFQVWDDATIDGDVISLIVNGNTVLNQITLDGPGNRHSVSVPLASSGYNYVILYAHNEGSVPPNTAALSLNDGRTTQNLVMSANLSTNGAYNIIVGSAPPPPSRPSCPVSPTTPTTPPPSSTVSMRWTLTDACGDGAGLHARFFDKTNNLVWPADSSKVFVTNSNGTIDVSLAANTGARVCYGAQPDSSSTNRYWGVGMSGNNGCPDCCYTAANTTIRLNLTCQ